MGFESGRWVPSPPPKESRNQDLESEEGGRWALSPVNAGAEKEYPDPEGQLESLEAQLLLQSELTEAPKALAVAKAASEAEGGSPVEIRSLLERRATQRFKFSESLVALRDQVKSVATFLTPLRPSVEDLATRGGLIDDPRPMLGPVTPLMCSKRESKSVQEFRWRETSTQTCTSNALTPPQASLLRGTIAADVADVADVAACVEVDVEVDVAACVEVVLAESSPVKKDSPKISLAVYHAKVNKHLTESA